MFAHLASLLFLSFAVSLDGFGVGITYGVRQIRIPAVSIVIISACSGLIILLAMLAGAAMSGWMSPHGASSVGAVILIGIGGWALAQFFRNREDEDGDKPPPGDAENAARPVEAGEAQRPVMTLELKLFGIIIQILRKPSTADVDRSGIISAGEAFLLGAALSLDAFGAGIGAGLVGFPPILTAVLIAAASGSFLWLGTRVGFMAAGWRWVNRLTVLPGIILIAMGIFKLL